MALARYISINFFTSALSRLNQKNPNIKSVQANLLTNLEIIILLLAANAILLDTDSSNYIKRADELSRIVNSGIKLSICTIGSPKLGVYILHSNIYLAKLI